MKLKPTLISMALVAAYGQVGNAVELANFHVDGAAAMPSLVRFHADALAVVPRGVAKQEWQSAVAAQNHLARLVKLGQLSPDALVGLDLRRVHDTGRGAIVVRYGQKVGGIPVFGSEMAVVMNRQHQLVATSGQLSDEVAKKLKQTEALRDAEFRLSAAELSRKAFVELGGKPTSVSSTAAKKAGRVQHTIASDNDINLQRGHSEKVYFASAKGLIPAYRVELQTARKNVRSHDAYAFVYSAHDGELLLRKNQTQNESFGYRVFADASGGYPWDGPQKRDGHPHPTGLKGANYKPDFYPPELVVLEKGPISTPDPWLAADATSTRGNNVDAYVDQTGADGYQTGDVRAIATAMVGGGKGFDYVLDTTIAANANDSQKMAAATEMFYVTNWLHDDFYGHGFDEAAGNAQIDNKGRGGFGNDPLLAEAQDQSGFNNANMSTPSDGESPTMQMYLYTFAGDSQLVVNSPAMDPIAATTASFGPDRYSPITADLVLLTDGVVGTKDSNGETITGTVNDGCETPTNAAALSGKIALIERGLCNFTVKVKNAQTAGAVAVVMYNNTADAMIAMGGDDTSISIPAIGINQSDGNALKSANANVTVSEPKPSRDSSFDALTIAHEWGHYITNRMIGDGWGLGNNQGGSMGEGWGDFHALLLTVEEQDLSATPAGWAAKFAMGGYSDQGKAANDVYFSGIRGVPYTTDMDATNGNPLTFKYIETDPEVHGSGTFWATVLWDCYAGLLNTAGVSFSEAQNRMKDYLVAAYAATPANPTFTEARDALLSVVRASNVDDYRTMSLAFARRGMGVGAVAPDRFSSDHKGVVESFKTSGDVSYSNVAMTLTKDVDEDGVLDIGDEADVTFTATSSGFVDLSNTSVSLTATGVTVDGVEALGAMAVGSSKNGSIHVTLNTATFAQDTTFTLKASDSAIDAAVSAATTFNRVLHYDLTANYTNNDGGNNVFVDWTQDRAIGDASAAISLAKASNNYYFVVPDTAVRSDIRLVSPEFTVATADQLTITWQQAYSFEASDPGDGTVRYWDGGAVEYSVDGGAWVNADKALTPTMDKTIFRSATDPDSSSVLGNTKGYSGVSSGFPALQTATLNLSGKGLGGKNVRVRFRAGSDASVGDKGWYIDNVSVSGASNKPFSVQVVDGSAGAAPAAATVAALAAEFTIPASASSVTVPVKWTATSGQFVTSYSLLVDGAVIATTPYTPASGAMDITTNYTANSEGSKQFAIRLCNGSVCADSASVSTTIKKEKSSGGGGGGGSSPLLALWLLPLLGLLRKRQR